jgi:hypothetical protein
MLRRTELLRLRWTVTVICRAPRDDMKRAGALLISTARGGFAFSASKAGPTWSFSQLSTARSWASVDMQAANPRLHLVSRHF